MQEQRIGEAQTSRTHSVAQENSAANSLDLWAARRVRMTLNQFALFAVVAKHKSLTKASEILRISQPAISQQLKQLEDYHGSKLFQRLYHGIEITEAGKLFLRAVTPILDQVAQLEVGTARSAKKEARETLRVGGTEVASAELLPAVLADFRRFHPAAELEMRTRTSDRLERMVATAALELAVTVREPRSSDLASEPLRRERIAMFVPSNHPLAEKNRLQLSEVLAEPLITRGGKGSSGVVDRALQQIRAAGLNFKIGIHCDGPTAIKAAVRKNMGVGIAFETAIRTEVASGEFKILKVPGVSLEGESFVIYPRRRKPSPLALEFLDLLRRAGCHTQEADMRQASRSRRRNPRHYEGVPAIAL
jgi:DNA-binding transcriptional LysR family regulator